MSNLYLARDLQHGGAVRVIKEMTARYPDPNEQKLAEQLFMREAQLLATLNHPNIPKVFDKFTFQGKYYLSMEYVKGEDLGKLITARGQIPEPEVANYGAQMATVLYYLHRQNPPIVFRDVKPSNIMIQGDQVKLIDFGIARLFTPAKKGDTMRIGSPGYAPPEQYSGATDPRSDVYALGVTLHHALTGHDPTVSQTPFLLPPVRQLNPKVSQEMVSIIERATQLDPDKRYPSMIEFKRDLQNVMRAHGMLVGASMPLGSRPLVAGAGPGSPAVAGAAPVPVGSAAGGSTPGTTQPPIPGPSASPAGVSPSPSPAPGPTAATGPAATAGTGAGTRSGGGWGRRLAVLFILFGLAGVGVSAARSGNPTALFAQIQQWLNPTLPADPGQAGQRLYLQGGPLPLAAELLTRSLAEKPGDVETRMAWAAALAANTAAGGPPAAATAGVHRVAVLVPQGESRMHWLRGFAMAQQALNARGGVDQKQIVLQWGDYAPGRLSSAIGAASDGRLGRRERKTPQPDLVIAAAPPEEWEKAGSPAKTVRVWTDESDDKAALPAPAVDWKAVVGRVQAGDPVWLAKNPSAPDKVKSAGLPAGAEELAKLLQGGPGQPLVIEPGQLEQLLGILKGKEVKIVVLAQDPAQLPKLEALPKNVSLQAVTPGSRFAKDDLAQSFYQLRTVFGEGPELYPVATRRAYDSLAWALTDKDESLSGLTFRLDAEGKLRAPRVSVFTAGANGWLFNREVEGGK